MSDNLNKEQRRRSMSNNKSRNTKPEVKVRKFLFSKGFRFRINDGRYPGSPDIVLPKYKTVIFINGCFWHQHSGCKRASMPKSNTDYWKKKLNGNVKRDKKNKQLLEELGWKVLVVWECEINENFELTMKNLITRIKESIDNPG